MRVPFESPISQRDPKGGDCRVTLNVEHAVNNLDEAVCGLLDRIGTLEDRLRPLLTPECPGEGQCAEPKQAVSEVAARVAGNSAAVSGVSARIQSLIERL